METYIKIKEIKVKKWHGSKPEKCDLCQFKFKQVFIDGKTIHGPWGLLCSSCHETYGVGLGTGRGQKYDLKSLEKLEG